jgi:ADP-ribose pyrophosphatase YjhB (NUDIX family)
MSEILYCPLCGHRVETRPRGERSRPVCPGCGWVGWRNPKAAVAVVLRNSLGRVLLVKRRSHPPGWCIPCGNIEWEEDIREAGFRELIEETGLEVEMGRVLAVHSNFHDPEAHSVGVWFEGRVIGGAERPGGDAEALGWFPPESPPEPLAFPTDRRVLSALARGGDPEED